MTLRGRAILVGLISLFMVFLCLPSLVSKDVRLGSDLIPDQAVNLGLDLQGGIYWLLRIKPEDAIQNQIQLVLDSFEEIRSEEGLNVGSPERVEGANSLRICDASLPALEDVVDTRFPRWSLEEDGLCQRMVLSRSGVRDLVALNVDQAIEVYQERLTEGGFVEPIIAKQGEERVLVQMPGTDFDDRQRALELISDVTLLEFKKVLDSAPNREVLEAAYPDGLPADAQIVEEKDKSGNVTEALLVPSRALLTGGELADAGTDYDRTGLPVVTFVWGAEGTKKFRDFTGDNVGSRMAIIKDGDVISAPEIRSRIGQRGQIEGNFTPQEARTLAVQLRAGALPIKPEIEEERTIGPSLGKDSIDAGTRSIIVGALLVVVFMWVYYRTSGLLANIALVLNLVIVFAVMSSFRATLTLPGIAGLLLTVGMAVDANVIIFERIREELRSGRAVRNAVQIGFNRSRLTILDANITTLIAAVVLYYVGHGPVQGFGVTLVIGIVSSVFCALVVTRLLFDLLLAGGSQRLRI